MPSIQNLSGAESNISNSIRCKIPSRLFIAATEFIPHIIINELLIKNILFPSAKVECD